MVTLTHERVRALFDYDPCSGALTYVSTWVHGRSGKTLRPAGAAVGTVNLRGYLRVGIDGTTYLCHRLIWLWVSGEWPKYTIDHIDGVRNNNAWVNLRDVPHAVNTQNIRKAQKRNKCGVLGVRWYKGCWRVQMSVGGITRHIGSYTDLAEAGTAYIKAKRELHEGCTL